MSSSTAIRAIRVVLVTMGAMGAVSSFHGSARAATGFLKQIRSSDLQGRWLVTRKGVQDRSYTMSRQMIRFKGSQVFYGHSATLFKDRYSHGGTRVTRYSKLGYAHTKGTWRLRGPDSLTISWAQECSNLGRRGYRCSRTRRVLHHKVRLYRHDDFDLGAAGARSKNCS